MVLRSNIALLPSFLLGVNFSDALIIASPQNAHTFELASNDDEFIGLWDGQDMEDEAPAQLELANHSAAASSAKQLRILGMFDSGTNVLSKTVQLNFGDAVTQTPQWVNPASLRLPHNEFTLGLWKHAPPVSSGSYSGWTDNVAAQVKKLNGLVVVMIRSPISQLTSLKKAPYNLRACMNKAFTYLNWACLFDSDPWQPVLAHTFPAPGPMGVWNEYISGYIELAKKHSNVMLVRYEDLVFNPEAVVQQIASRLGLQAPSPVKIVGASAKDHGASIGREAAMKKIKDHAYLNMYDVRSHIGEICYGLHRELDAQIPLTKPPNGPPLSSDCGPLNSTSI